MCCGIFVTFLSTSNGESLHSLQRSFEDPAQYSKKVSGIVLCVLLYRSYLENQQHSERIYLILGAGSAEIGVYYRLGIVSFRVGIDSHIWFEDMNRDVITII
jgi:hypothetical protein